MSRTLAAVLAATLAGPAARPTTSSPRSSSRPAGRCGERTRYPRPRQPGRKPPTSWRRISSRPRWSDGSGPTAVATYWGEVSVVAPFGGGQITDAPLVMRLRLTDLGSGESGLLTFHGTFSGFVADRDLLVLPDGASPTRRRLTLGGSRYQVSVPAFGAESIQGTANLTANVVVSPVTAPEPSSLLLAGAGVALLGGSRMAKRRARR